MLFGGFIVLDGITNIPRNFFEPYFVAHDFLKNAIKFDWKYTYCMYLIEFDQYVYDEFHPEWLKIINIRFGLNFTHVLNVVQ